MAFMAIDPYTGKPHRYAGVRAMQRSGALRTNCSCGGPALNAADREALNFVKKDLGISGASDEAALRKLRKIVKSNVWPYGDMRQDYRETMRSRPLHAEDDDEEEVDEVTENDDAEDDVDEEAIAMSWHGVVDYIQRGKRHSAAEQRQYRAIVGERRMAAQIREKMPRGEPAWKSSQLTKALRRNGAEQSRRAAAEKARAVALTQGRNRRAGR